MPRKTTPAPIEEGPLDRSMTTLLTPDGQPLETDGSLVAAAEAIFGDDLAEVNFIADEEPDITSPLPDHAYVGPPDAAPVVAPDEPDPSAESTALMNRTAVEVADTSGWGTPDAGDFINLKGGAYLPARRRIIWMRGLPMEHPDWTIKTEEVYVEPGSWDGRKLVGGYARMRAEILDEKGRLIGSGTKCEYSERFMDFVEKAETGAIARALAVCGYGTESALDLDEGVDDDRIADAPVPNAGRPINITASSVPGIKVGGRPAGVTAPQLQEIARLARTLSLGLGLSTVIESVLEVKMPPLDSGMTGKEAANKHLMGFLQTLTFEQAATLIRALTQGVNAKATQA